MLEGQHTLEEYMHSGNDNMQNFPRRYPKRHSQNPNARSKDGELDNAIDLTKDDENESRTTASKRDSDPEYEDDGKQSSSVKTKNGKAR